MCPARRERNLQGLVTEPLSFPFLYVLGDKENLPNWQTPFNLDYGSALCWPLNLLAAFKKAFLLIGHNL